MIAAADAYRGGIISVANAFRAARRRWLSQVVTAIAFGVAGVIIAVVLPIGAVLAGGARNKGIALALLIAATLPLYLAWHLAVVAISIEKPRTGRIFHAFTRVLDASVRWRSVGVTVSLVVAEVAGGFVFLILGNAFSSVTHIAVLAPISEAVGGAVTGALIICFLVIYSYDVRVRLEGYELAPEIVARYGEPAA